ncbi:hypothetical protein BDR04DRAFT_1154846 [Suillus decipiens]|nr:hypothetical protein BDR04DRAFT_1154846 [Suillus decipiens]
MDDTPHLNWQEVDWEHFNKVLSMALAPAPPLLLASADEFQQMAWHIMQAITSTMEMCELPNHPYHTEYRTLKNCYADKITSTKKQHWIDWIEDLEGNNLWMASCYVSLEPTDGGKSHIPTLIAKNPDGSTVEASTNGKKSILIAEAFFSPPPLTDSIPADFIY